MKHLRWNPQHLRFVCLAVVLLLACTHATQVSAHRQKLTNQDVMKMVKAGLSPETVIQTIKSTDSNLDVSADALIDLKKEGVPESVIRAMQDRADSTGAAQPQSPFSDTNAPRRGRDLVLIDGTQRIEMQHGSNELRTGGLAGAMVPFKSTKVRKALSGNHAQLRTTNTSPAFEVSLPSNAHPSDLVELVRLDVKSDRREIETASFGITAGKHGFPKDRLVPISIEEVLTEDKATSGYSKLYRVKLVNPIGPGEYALVGQGIYYDFGVDTSK